MNESKLQLLVMEAIDLDRTIAKETERLKNLKAMIVLEAKGGAGERTATEGGGWSVEFTGAKGDIARVTKPGDKLKSSIDAESDTWTELRDLLAGRPERLFKPGVKYAPLENFRELVAAGFTPADQKKILKAMTTKSSPTVSFETKEGA